MTDQLPELAKDDVIQVVMSAAFYTAHFRPLLEEQDFGLVKIPSAEEDPDALATYVVTLAGRRAQMLRRCDPATDYHATPHVGCIMR